MMQPPNIIQVLSVLKKYTFSFILTQDYIKPLIKLAICTILRDETNVKLEKTRILHYFLV